MLDPTRRYDFDKIVSHRWMTDGSSDFEFKRLMEDSQEIAHDFIERPLDGDVLARMKCMGMDPDQVKQVSSSHFIKFATSTTHCMVSQRKRREEPNEMVKKTFKYIFAVQSHSVL